MTAIHAWRGFTPQEGGATTPLGTSHPARAALSLGLRSLRGQHQEVLFVPFDRLHSLQALC